MKIGIIGLGNLGSAVTKLIEKNGHINTNLYLADTRDLSIFRQYTRFENIQVIENSDILFLCCKPNDIKIIIDEINSSKEKLLFSSETYSPDKIIVSCAAGISLDYFNTKLKSRYPIIRMMTNIPISLGQGSITYINNELITREHNDKFKEILKGPMLLSVRNENLLDVSTVLTGCMPAFTAFFSNEIINFGIKRGFTYEQSRDLYIATIQGTMEVLKTSSCDKIIDAVSSPNGVTEKGINYLETSGIRNILFSTLYKSYESISSLSKKKD